MGRRRVDLVGLDTVIVGGVVAVGVRGVRIVGVIAV